MNEPQHSGTAQPAGSAPGEGAALQQSKIRQLARTAAAAIHEAFDDYHSEFKAVTRRAQERFERREWSSGRMTRWNGWRSASRCCTGWLPGCASCSMGTPTITAFGWESRKPMRA